MKRQNSEQFDHRSVHFSDQFISSYLLGLGVILTNKALNATDSPCDQANIIRRSTHMKRKNSIPPIPIAPHPRSLLSLLMGLNMGIILAAIVGLVLTGADLGDLPWQKTGVTPTAAVFPAANARLTGGSVSDSAPTVNLVYSAGVQANTPVDQLLEHCDYTDNTYMLYVHAVGDDFSSSLTRTSVHSPDGRYVTFELGGEVYLQKVGEPELLKLEGDFTRNPKYLTWEPGGARALFADPTDNGHNLHLFDFRAGLKNAKQTVLPIPYALNNGNGQWAWVPNQDSLIWQSDYGLEIWSVAQRSRVYFQPMRALSVAVSYDGTNLAILSTVPNQRPADYTLTLVQTNAQGEQIIDVDLSGGNGLLWAPDNRHLAVIGTQEALNGTQPDIIQIYAVGEDRKVSQNLPNNLRIDSVAWSADSESLIFWETGNSNNFQLSRWHFADGRKQTLDTSDRVPQVGPYQPISAENTQYIGQGYALREPVARQQTLTIDNGKLYLSNQDGSEPLVLATNVYTVESYAWASDNMHLAVVWWPNTDNGVRRVTWTDGATVYGFKLASDQSVRLDWAADGQFLAVEYIDPAQHQRYLVLLDATTGESHRLGPGFDQLYSAGFHHPGALYAFHWRDRAGNYGYEGYDENGRRQFRVSYTNPRPWAIDAVFFSPDGEWAALKTFAPDSDLYLARTDGSPNEEVRTDMRGLGDPFWSPDSRLIAFTEWDGDQQTVSIVDVAGQTRWKTPFPYEIREVYMTWEPCGAENQ